MDRAGGVMAFSRDGQRIWSIQLDSAVVGGPVIVEQLVWIVTQAGKLSVRELATGKERETLTLGTLPSGGIVMAGRQELVAAGNGTIRPVVADSEAEKSP
jgi:outer membrane protein assembly factor BamB